MLHRSTRLASLVALLGCFVAAPVNAAEIRVPGDHATIQAAIDAAEAGDVVVVSAGTYRERIRLKPGVTVRSAGDDARGETGLKRAEATILDGGGAEGDGPGVTMAAGSTLDGLTVTNVGVYDDTSWQHHYDTHGDEQKHEHIGHFGTPGVGIQGTSCNVVNCIVHHNGATGIAIRGAKDRECSPRVARNVCFRNMGGGIGSMAGSTATIEHNVCFENFYAGIGHDGAHPIVRHNECYGNVRAGIGISEGACPVVRHNRCYENRRAGIGTRTGAETQPVIEHNECYENAMAGIGTDEQAQPIIRGNRCYRNAMAGIGSQNHAAPIIVGNESFENAMAGIGSRKGARPIIVRNTSRKNAKAGIGVRGTETRAIIVENRCIENELVALGLPDGATAFVHGNHFQRTGGVPPLIAVKGQSTATLTENTIRGGGVAGVLVEGRAGIRGNDFLGKGPGQGSAVWVWKGSHVDVSENRFDAYGNAVNAAGSAVRVSDNVVRRFQKVAILVRKPSAAAVVVGNVAVSPNEEDEAVLVEGETAVVSGNARRAEPPAKAPPSE